MAVEAWIDALSRTLARGATRKEFLRLLGLGAAGALLAPAGALPAGAVEPQACRPNGEPCSVPSDCCSNACDVDKNRCVDCLQPRKSCTYHTECCGYAQGLASCNETSGWCRACIGKGRKLCFDACVNTQTDARNCGACGTRCREDQVCKKGECDCPAGEIECFANSYFCVDPRVNVFNCGGCNPPCGAGEKCRDRVCKPLPCARWDISGTWQATGFFTDAISYTQAQSGDLTGYCSGGLTGSVVGREVRWRDESGGNFSGRITDHGAVIAGTYRDADGHSGSLTMVGQARCTEYGD